MVGGISDRHKVEKKNGLKEWTSDFTGARNINVQWWMTFFAEGWHNVEWNVLFISGTEFIDQHQRVGPSCDLNSLYFFLFVETVFYVPPPQKQQFLSCFTDIIPQDGLLSLKKNKKLRPKYSLPEVQMLMGKYEKLSREGFYHIYHTSLILICHL